MRRETLKVYSSVDLGPNRAESIQAINDMLEGMTDNQVQYTHQFIESMFFETEVEKAPAEKSRRAAGGGAVRSPWAVGCKIAAK